MRVKKILQTEYFSEECKKLDNKRRGKLIEKAQETKTYK